MIITLILFFLVPVIILGLTVFAVGSDLFSLFKGPDLIGRLFSDLIHVLLLWVVGSIVELWLLYTLLAHWL